jgi:hypothetical protein
MSVMYQGEAWFAPYIRGSLFNDYKNSNPDLLVSIVKGGETKQVAIRELIDY